MTDGLQLWFVEGRKRIGTVVLLVIWKLSPRESFRSHNVIFKVVCLFSVYFLTIYILMERFPCMCKCMSQI